MPLVSLFKDRWLATTLSMVVSKFPSGIPRTHATPPIEKCQMSSEFKKWNVPSVWPPLLCPVQMPIIRIFWPYAI